MGIKHQTKKYEKEFKYEPKKSKNKR